MWDIPKALEAINSGEIICFKTDTVPGIACDPLNQDAINKIYQLKSRDQRKPLVIMIADINELDRWVEEYPDNVRMILKNKWPGNLTVIFKRNRKIPDIFDTETIGVRIPDKDILRDLLRETGNGLAVTSANVSGEEELHTIQQVREKFGDRIAVYLNDEEPQTDVPSTIIDVSQGDIKVLRGEFDA